jgi:hypothetical protein
LFFHAVSLSAGLYQSSTRKSLAGIRTFSKTFLVEQQIRARQKTTRKCVRAQIRA